MSDSTNLREELERERKAREQAEARVAELEARVRNGSGDGTVRSQFVASMGHTLRTPLNGVLGFADVLLEGTFGTLSDRQVKYVKRIIESGHRQLELINNLVDLSKIHAGETRLECAPTAIMDVVESAASELRLRAEEKGLTVETRADGEVDPINCDAERLRQVVANLLSNAIRATEPGGRIMVVARQLADRENGHSRAMQIQVSDTGPGIPSEDQPLLFDDFDNAESMATRRQRRSGTGLALARRIVELHGGRISVESDGANGHGSRFTIELPSQGAA